MPRLIAFLRAINVGGHNPITMDKLRALFEGLGYKEVETFIASGNVIFTSSSKSITSLQHNIEVHLHKLLGYKVDTFIRTDKEVAAIASYKPFKESQIRAAKTLNVAFLTQPLTAVQTKSLMSLRTAIDDFHVHCSEMYWLCKKGQSESHFSNALFEKTCNVRSTFRGINTIVKLAAKYAL